MLTNADITLYECYGEYEENSEEVCWGPYSIVCNVTVDKPFAEWEPSDFLVEGAIAEDVVYEEDFLMFDVTHDLPDENRYVRYNYLARSGK